VLGFHLGGDAEPFDHADEVHAGGALCRIADRLGGEQRALERLGRADVGLGRTGLDREAHAGAGKIDAAAGDLPRLGEVIDRRSGQNGNVRRLALEVAGLERRRVAPGDRHLVPGGALEFGNHLGQRRLHADGAQHLDLIGFDNVDRERGNDGKPRHRGGQRSIPHGVLPGAYL
jgi:hypothetical protein